MSLKEELEDEIQLAHFRGWMLKDEEYAVPTEYIKERVSKILGDKNMLAIGNDELGEYVKKGDRVRRGELEGVVEYGTETGKETNLLGCVTVEDGTSYLVAIKDQLIGGWEKI